MQLFKLFGSILIDDKEANNSLSKVEKKTGGVGKKLGSMIGTAAKVGAGIAAGAGVAIGGMVALGLKVGNAADEILDLNSITGMSTDNLQKWRKAAEVAGVATDAVAKTSEKFTKSLSGMTGESNKGNLAMQELGFSLEQIQGMSADERMNALTDALSGVEDKTRRAELGSDLFAGTWSDIAPIVDLGTEAMNRAKDSANIISEEDLKKANDFRISVANMKDQVSFFVTEIGIALLPMLQGMFDWIQGQMPVIRETMKVVFEAINIAIQTAITWIQTIVDKMKSWFDESNITLESLKETFFLYLDLIKERVQFVFDTLWEIISKILELVVPYVQEKLAVLQKYWDENGEAIMKAVDNAFKLIKGIVEFIMPILIEVIETAWNIISGVFDGAFKAIGGLLDIFIGVFTGDWTRAWEGVKQVFEGIWDGIVAGLKGSVNLIITALNVMIRGINKLSIKIPDWVPGFGGKEWGINIPQIPKLAEGGNILDNGSVMVGEEGPEILSNMKGAKVTPLDKVSQPEYIIIENYMDGKKIGESVARPLGNISTNRGRSVGLA
jgi:hypothetical protein